MEQQAAFRIPYLPVTISLISMETADLPAHLGSTLRGAIGQALMRHEPTAYAYLYENRTRGGRQQDVLNPYVIVPPDGATFHAGETLRFDLLLLGEAARYAQPLFNALQRADKLGLGALRYPFAFQKAVHAEDSRVLWEAGLFHGIAAREVLLPYRTLPDIQKATVRTRTPLRIRRDGALLLTVDFPTIMRSVTRRVEAIATRYGGWADATEIARVQGLSAGIATARSQMELQNMARYSNRLGEKMDFSGLAGSMQFEGELTP
ncbi:MAG TPA: hypothetical protein PKE04_22615, partial [Clostridia bacterium]|nr:hypothetical protein [Clostridia bacterium]